MVLRWLAVALILRVLAAIVSNYGDYFPPNFDSLFLQGRETTFGEIDAAASRIANQLIASGIAPRCNRRCT